jgi:hypothetical protein
MLGVIENVMTKRVAAALQTAERMNDAKNKDDFEENLAILEGLIHDMWLICSGAPAGEVANVDLADRLQPIAAKGSAATFASWMEEIELMRGRFAVNINRKIATDAFFVGMAGV